MLFILLFLAMQLVVLLSDSPHLGAWKPSKYPKGYRHLARSKQSQL